MNTGMVIAIDFDGTIVSRAFPKIGVECLGACKWIEKFQSLEARIILYTVRSGDPLKEAVTWLNKQGIYPWGINKNAEQTELSRPPKVYAQIYIDDSAFGAPLKDDLDGNPCVDWNTVGPEVVKILKGEKELANAMPPQKGEE